MLRPEFRALCLCRLSSSPESLGVVIPNYFQQSLFGNSDMSSLSYHVPGDPQCNFFIFTPTYSRCKVSLLKCLYSDQAYKTWNLIQYLQHNLVFSTLLSIIPWGGVPCWTLIWCVLLFWFCPATKKEYSLRSSFSPSGVYLGLGLSSRNTI